MSTGEWHLEEFQGHRSRKEKEPAEESKIGEKNRKVQCPRSQGQTFREEGVPLHQMQQVGQERSVTR